MNEATFTRPSEECPHPERWHSYDDDSAEVEVAILVAALVTALQPDLVVETGTAHGYTANLVGTALSMSGHGELFTLETDPMRCEEARSRCEGLPVTVECVSSMEWKPPGPIDFAFFDSLFGLRRKEYERFSEWFTSRTVVAFHDTAPHHPLRHSLADLGLVYLPTPRGFAIGRWTP